MGVKRLYQIVKYFAHDCITEKTFKDYRGTTQALDTSIILYKFCIALMSDGGHFKKDDGEIVGHLFACFFKTISMLRYGIMPVWIFDGSPPTIKQDTIDERRKIKELALTKLTHENVNINEKYKLQKKAFSVTTKQINEIIKLLDYLGINYIEAPGEAEAQCAAMNISNMCDGVVTEDWDAVLFGCKKMLKDFSNKSPVIEINVGKLMEELKINQEQLIDLCSILGNDYCNGIGGIKPIDAFKKFKKANFDMNEFLDTLRKENKVKFKYKIPDNFKNDWLISKNYYLHAPVIKPDAVKIEWKEPQYDNIYKYLVLEKKFNSDAISLKLDELKKMYTYYVSNGQSLITLSRINKYGRKCGPNNYNDPKIKTKCLKS